MRLNLQTIKDRLETNVVVAGQTITFGTAYDRNYMTAYSETFPAVWVAGQKLSAVSGSQPYTGLHHQKMRAVVPVRLVIQRYESGQTAAEDLMDQLFEQVYLAMFGWKSPDAAAAFYFDRTEDGPADDSILVADMFFSAEIRLRTTT